MSGLPKDNKKKHFLEQKLKEKGDVLRKMMRNFKGKAGSGISHRLFLQRVTAGDPLPTNTGIWVSPSQKGLVELCQGFTSPATRANYGHPELCIGAGGCVEPPLPAPCSPSCNLSSPEPQKKQIPPVGKASARSEGDASLLNSCTLHGSRASPKFPLTYEVKTQRTARETFPSYY